MLMNKKRAFGNAIVGFWHCTCGFEIFPKPLKEQQENFKWIDSTDFPDYVHPCCPLCNKKLSYDEAA